MRSLSADRPRALHVSLVAALLLAACTSSAPSPTAAPVPSAPEPPSGWAAVGGVGGAAGEASANTIAISLRPGQAALNAVCQGSGTLLVVFAGQPGGGAPEPLNGARFACSTAGSSPQRIVLSVAGGQTTVEGYVIEGAGTAVHAVWFVSVEQPA